MTDMEKEKLIDYLFCRNESLEAKLAGVQEELRLQREQSAELHRSFSTQLNRMEERAVAAERRAEAEARMRMELDNRISELTAALAAMMNRTVDHNHSSPNGYGVEC